MVEKRRGGGGDADERKGKKSGALMREGRMGNGTRSCVKRVK